MGLFATAVLTLVTAGQTFAGGLGRPEEWQMGLQQAASPIAHDMHSFHTFLLWIITIISLFVLALLITVLVKFNAKANPVPSKTTHNTMIEVVWTVVPVLILIAIAIPSFRLLFLQRDIPDAEITIKATGHQWYWEYDYPDNGDINFSSAILLGDDLEERRKIQPDAPRLLATDNPVVVPIDTTVRMIVTAAPDGVIHAWTIPSFGSKIDAIPGRLNELWFKADTPGVYYGQCSELCGKDHAYMPIELHVVPKEDYEAWTKAAASDLDEANKMIYANLSGTAKLAAKTE
jgi:cytochrome c oxidase subunit 2